VEDGAGDGVSVQLSPKARGGMAVRGLRIGLQCAAARVHAASAVPQAPRAGAFTAPCTEGLETRAPPTRNTPMNRNAVTTLAVAVALAVGAGAAVAKDRGSRTERDVQDRLAAEGYTNTRDIEFDDGMWEAEARRSDGRDLDLRIDPRTGAIHPEDAGTNLSAEDIEASLTAAGYSRIHDVDFDD